MIEIGDLVVVIYPYMDWDWQRYKIGDIGIVMDIRVYSNYTVAKVKLFRTSIVESIPLDYIALLGEKDGSG
tara:strand:- start:943 stop:1155 length:213 start_codon:yes stop_codon:yes gene_type:complete